MKKSYFEDFTTNSTSHINLMVSVMLYLAEFRNEWKMRFFSPSVYKVNQFLLFIKVTTCFYNFNYVIYIINCLGLNILCPNNFLFGFISDLPSWSLYSYCLGTKFLKIKEFNTYPVNQRIIEL